MNILDEQLNSFLYVDLIPVVLLAAAGYLSLKYLETKHGENTGNIQQVMCPRIYTQFAKTYNYVTNGQQTAAQFAQMQNDELNYAYGGFKLFDCPMAPGASVESYNEAGGGHIDCTKYGNETFSQSMLNCEVMQNLDPTVPAQLAIIESAQTLWNQFLYLTDPAPTIQWPFVPGPGVKNCQCVDPTDNNQMCCWLHSKVGPMILKATGKYPTCPSTCKNANGVYCDNGNCDPYNSKLNCNLYH